MSMDRAALAYLRHELRTPLNHIIGYSEMLLEDAADGDPAALEPGLRRVHEDAQRLLTIINDLVRADAAHVDLERLSAELAEPLRSVITAVAELKLGAVRAGAERAGQDLDRVASAASALHSVITNGVRAPDAQSATQTTAAAPAPATQARVEAGAILIVDDNAANREMLGRRLERDGHRVQLAGGGREALEFLREQRVDLVLLDVMMPDMDGIDVFETEMDKQRDRGRAARKTDVVVAATEDATSLTHKPTVFIGYTDYDSPKQVETTGYIFDEASDSSYIILRESPFYAEMGGQVGDTGWIQIDNKKYEILDTQKDKYGRHLHRIKGWQHQGLLTGKAVAIVNVPRRRAINRHHSAAHLIHWALRKILGAHVRQFGTHKTPDRMRFDFTHFEQVTPAQLKECEQLINEKVIDNSPVVSAEIDYDKKPADVLAFFGDKYGKRVRLVDIGGYSKELCGGTHVSTTGEIGVIKIVAEMAIAAGTRRIEAVAGQAALDYIAAKEAALSAISHRLNAGVHDVVRKFEISLSHQKELEKKLKAYEAKASAGLADELAATAVAKDGLKWVSAIVTTDSPETLRSLGSQVLHKVGNGVVQLGASFDGKVSLVAFCSPEAIKAGHQAGKLISGLTAKLGGKGGGKPDFAMGGGGEASKLEEVLKI